MMSWLVIERRTTFLMISVLAIGCAQDSDRAVVSDSAGTTSAPVVMAGAATEPAVTERGIGALRAGMTITEASEALAGALVVSASADTASCGYVQWRGGPHGVRVMVEGGRIARVEVDSAGVRTSLGAEVGDREEEVRRLYGGRVVVTPHKYEEGHYLTVIDPADSRFALVFETGVGKVTRYRAGRRPQVEYVEGCA